MKLIDTHAHLDDRAFDDDRAAVIASAFEKEIGIVAIGADLRSSRDAVRLAGRHRGVWAAIGAHPHGAKDVTAGTLGALEGLAKRETVIAIGEIGLDYYRDLSPRDVQREVFRRQLELARRLDLPICLHNRESTEDLLGILRETGSEHRGVVHSFLGDAAVARAFVDLGLHLGIGGPITFSKNADLREAVRRVPLDRLVVETDSPYLTPVPYRGRRNEPSYVAYVAEEIAKVKDLPVGGVAQRTTENAVRLFKLDV